LESEHVDDKDVLETVDGLDSAFAVTDSGIVNHGIERPQEVRLIGEPTGLGDAREVAHQHAVCLRRGGARVPGPRLVAGVEDCLMPGGQQSLRRPEAETVR
jgi:hypothetical protein